MGNGTQVIIGDGLADQAAAHGENFDIDLSTLFNRVGQAESNIKIGAGSKQTVLCPNGSLVFFFISSLVAMAMSAPPGTIQGRRRHPPGKRPGIQ